MNMVWSFEWGLHLLRKVYGRLWGFLGGSNLPRSLRLGGSRVIGWGLVGQSHEAFVAALPCAGPGPQKESSIRGNPSPWGSPPLSPRRGHILGLTWTFNHSSESTTLSFRTVGIWICLTAFPPSHKVEPNMLSSLGFRQGLGSSPKPCHFTLVKQHSVNFT